MKYIRIVCAVLLLLAGAAILFWPRFQGNRIEKAEKEAVQVFRSLPKNIEEKERAYAALYEEMTGYNKIIYAQRQQDLKDPWSCEQKVFDLASYGLDSDVVGILDVPSCGIQMPIYLGASNENLLKGACVISNTSMPIGGENTNCVLAGHRSMYSATMFRHLDMVQVGDSVLITNLWERLVYTVVQIRIIEPSDVGEILIQEGRDLLTLITCHPYGGGGRQRLMVLCERVDNNDAS